MGVDTRINLSEGVDLAKVALVIAYCAGAQRARGPDGEPMCPTLELKTESFGGDLKYFKAEFIDAAGHHRMVMLYPQGDTNAEDEGPGPTLYPKSTAFWIAVGRRLIACFGGKLDCDDADSIDWDEELAPPKQALSWHERVESVEPLNWHELEAANERAHAPTSESGKAVSWLPWVAAGEARELARTVDATVDALEWTTAKKARRRVL